MHLDQRDIGSTDSKSDPLAAEACVISQPSIEVLDAINDRVFLKDTLGRVIYVNAAFLRAFQLEYSDVIGKPLEEFLPREMVMPCKSCDSVVLERGEPVCLETHWQDSDGNHHWNETHKLPRLDSDGTVIGLVGVSRDISDRRAAEEELKHQKMVLEQIIETVPDLVFVKDLERRITVANQKYCDFMGLSHEEVIGKDTSTTLSPEVFEASRKTDAVVLDEGLPSHHNISRTDEHGNLNFLEVRKLPLMQEGEITGILSVCRDLTEQKRVEEESKRNEALLLHASRLSSIGELVAGIAHEVNQPLFSILNYAKAVENSLSEEGEMDVAAIRKWVGQIHKEASRGGKITQRLKSFVKRSESLQKPSDLNQIVCESLEFIAIEARDVGLTIEQQLEENLPTLMLDRIQFQQVLVNLLKNAIEALKESTTASPRVLITTQLGSSGVEVTVADNGPGVSVDSDVNILDPFQTTKHEGIGLGLAISNTIIEAHQGKLDYLSNDWGGATFCFTLPITNER